MTLTIDIPDEAADRVRNAAQARGQDVNTFAVAAVLETAGDTKPHIESARFDRTDDTLVDRADDTLVDHVTGQTAGALLLAQFKNEGLLTGYGDPDVDSPELAGRLREQFSRRSIDLS